jgi:outer membrane receptor for Fe3+-dicitrate
VGKIIEEPSSSLVAVGVESDMAQDQQTLSIVCLALIAITRLAVFPLTALAEELKNEVDQLLNQGIPDVLQLLKEEETVSIASRYEQPISQAPSNVHVITDKDIHHSGATDLPTILRRVPGIEIMQVTGADFIVTRWLSEFANASYQQITQTFVGAGRRGAPTWKVNAELRGEWDNGLSSEATVHYVTAARYPGIETYQTLAPFGATGQKSRVDGYTLLNLRGAHRFWKQQTARGYVRDAEVAVSAFKSLNDKHKEHPLGYFIGSRVMGWLTVRF